MIDWILLHPILFVSVWSLIGFFLLAAAGNAFERSRIALVVLVFICGPAIWIVTTILTVAVIYKRKELKKERDKAILENARNTIQKHHDKV
jgi:heme/copper-type cytochrome/quinol oxidase subunit 2